MPEMSRTGRNRSFQAIFPSTRSSRTAVHLSGSRGIRLQRGYPSASEFPDRSRNGTRVSKPDRRTRSRRSGKRTKREIFPDGPPPHPISGANSDGIIRREPTIFLSLFPKRQMRSYSDGIATGCLRNHDLKRPKNGKVRGQFRSAYVVPGHRRPGRSGSWFLGEYRSI